MVGVAKKNAFWHAKRARQNFKFQFHEKISYKDDSFISIAAM